MWGSDLGAWAAAIYKGYLHELRPIVNSRASDKLVSSRPVLRKLSGNSQAKVALLMGEVLMTDHSTEDRR